MRKFSLPNTTMKPLIFQKHTMLLLEYAAFMHIMLPTRQLLHLLKILQEYSLLDVTDHRSLLKCFYPELWGGLSGWIWLWNTAVCSKLGYILEHAYINIPCLHTHM